MNTSNLLEKILDSVFYNSSLKKASRLSKNTVGILKLLKGVLSKIQTEGKSTVLQSIKDKVLTLGKMLKFYATGDYRNIDLKNVVIIITAFVYFLSPVDLIPDFIPMLGFADDVALVTFVFNSISEEIEKFETWLLNRDIS
ncbi:MAG TPA: YkvA family protein [Leadbetterella sp.]|nr:YkvA family protein [Leadbetterella sp.]